MYTLVSSLRRETNQRPLPKCTGENTAFTAVLLLVPASARICAVVSATFQVAPESIVTIKQTLPVSPVPTYSFPVPTW